MNPKTDPAHASHRRQLLAATLALPFAIPARAQTGAAQDRPIRIIVPFAAGAGTDAVARLIAPALAQSLARPVVVENRTGASGAIGARLVAQSPPDGTTLLLVASPFTTVAAVNPKAGYDPLADFSPVGLIASGPLLWAGSAQTDARTLTDWVQRARERPGSVLYGSAGAGGINHLMLELLNAQTRAPIVHVPYRGTAPAVVDLVGGQIHLLTGTIPALAPFVRDGRIKALAVSTPKRTPALPDVPGMSEAGLADFSVNNYFGLVAPRGTPQAVIERINEALPRLLAAPDVQARFKTDALEPASLGSAALGQFLAQDYSGWQKVVAAQGIKLDSV